MRSFLARSLSLGLSAVWEQLNAEANGDPVVNNTQTIDHFNDRLREIIAVHSTPEDRYELAQYLRVCRKPRELPVQAFWYKRREFNTYIDWLHGTEPVLNQTQTRALSPTPIPLMVML